MKYILISILAAGGVTLLFTTLSWLANVIAWIREGKRDKKREEKMKEVDRLLAMDDDLQHWYETEFHSN